MKKLFGFFLWVCLLGSYGRLVAQTVVISCPDTFQSVFSSEYIVSQVAANKQDSVLRIPVSFSFWKMDINGINMMIWSLHGRRDAEDIYPLSYSFRNGDTVRCEVLDFYQKLWELSEDERNDYFKGGEAIIRWGDILFDSVRIDTIYSQPRRVYISPASAADKAAFEYVYSQRDSVSEMYQFMDIDCDCVGFESVGVLNYLANNYSDTQLGLISQYYINKQVMFRYIDQPELTKKQMFEFRDFLKNTKIPIAIEFSKAINFWY